MTTNGQTPTTPTTPTTISVPQAPAGDVVKTGFAETSMQRQTETSSDALAAQATASVQARYLMAIKRPRDWEAVRVALLKACKRPGFAQDAIYAKPMGGETIQGPSIRFAEEAARAMTNVLSEIAAIYDDSKKRIVRVTVTDLESNLTFYKDVNVEKSVERKFPKKGTVILAQRTNSYGEPVFLVVATEDEAATKEAALCSKQLRELLLRLLPSDIKEDAFNQIRETRQTADAADPDAAKRRVIDSFFDLGVDPKQLAEFLGHDLGALNPAELHRLRSIYAGLKDGETTWADVMAQKREASAGAPKPEAPPAAGSTGGGINDAAARARAARQASVTPSAGGAARPAADLPLGRSDVPNSTTVVGSAADGAAVATALSKDQGKPAEDPGDAPTAGEIAAQEAAQARPVPTSIPRARRGGQSSLPSDDDDVPSWGGGQGKSK